MCFEDGFCLVGADVASPMIVLVFVCVSNMLLV